MSFAWLTGDTHLAIFRVSKLENSEVTEEADDSTAKPKPAEADSPSEG